jgi:AAA family ATP:ADP antiporter
VLAKLLGLRPEDRRDTLVAFCTLVAILAAHSMLETARDALFLEKLPPESLPLAYIGIAALALVVSKVNQAATARFERRKLLSISLVVGGIITAGFYQLTDGRDPWMLGALYVWTGVLATVVVVQFWLQLGDVLNIDQAKRVFSIIGAGGLVGATIGSASAGAMLTTLDARYLLLVAGGLFVVASVVPLGFSPKQETDEPRRRRQAVKPATGSPALALFKDVYLVRLFLIVVVGAVLVTGVDYLFKATIVEAAQREGWNLGVVFARFYAVVNLLSLIVQLALAPRLLRVLGVNRSLLLMPALLLFGAVGFVVTAGLLPALILKGGDGALRHSVHKTASEILYLPLQRKVRERFKGFAEALGQRGGQAVASLLILGITALSPDPRIIGGGLVVLALAWVWVMRGMESHYLDLFRRQLRAGTLETEVDVPDLDLASFELLVQALSAEDDLEVLATLDMFESYGKTDLVPALILYHPSRDVVMRAFDMFARTDRADVKRLTGRLLKHDDAEIRAAALRMLASSEPDEAVLRGHFEDEDPMVRCTALVALVIAGLLDDVEATKALKKMVGRQCSYTHLSLARAVRQLPHDRFGWVAEELATLGEPGLGREVARSIAASPHPRYVPILLGLLEYRDSRADARDALVAVGDEAMEQVGDALASGATPRGVRLHLPRTLSRFPSKRAAEILLEQLPNEKNHRVVFKILRGLGRMRATDPALPLDKKTLHDVTQKTLEEAVNALHWRLAVGKVVAWKQEALTPAAELMIAFLDEKRELAIERVFRLLHILSPAQSFRLIHDALKTDDKKAKASGRELISHVVPSPLKEGLLCLVDDLSPRKKLKACLEFHDPPGRELFETVMARLRDDDSAENLRELGFVYADTLRSMLADPSEALRALVAYHVAELGLEELMDEVKGAEGHASDVLHEVAGRNFGLFSIAPAEPELSGA